MNAPTDNDRQQRWYALKVYYNRVEAAAELLRTEGLDYYDPSEAVPSLLFVHCTLDQAERLGAKEWQRMWVYRHPGSRRPSAIPDHEMEVFRFVVSAGHEGLLYLGDDQPKYHVGDRVRVVGGPFQGTEGHICRIKRDRRVVVSIRGVVAVATTYIHPSLLQRI